MRLSVLVSLLVLPLNAVAQDAPDSGIVYNTKENSSITYQCQRSGAEMLCDFSQVAVRKEANPDELPAKLAEARAQFRRDGSGVTPGDCKAADEMGAVLQGKKQAPKPDAMAAMSPRQRQDSADLLREMSRLCREKSEAAYLALVTLGHQRSERTCRVSANSFQQRFTLVAGASGESSWVVRGTPEGPCGVVQVSRFTADRQGGYRFWQYYARKVVTNPDGVWLPGAPPILCKEQDQREYLYDWRSQERFVGCDYVKFTVF